MWSGASVEGEGYYPTGPRWFEGGVLMVIGAIGTITSGIMLRVRKRELR